MNKRTLAIALLGLGFLLSLHQYVNWGTWFQVSDVHHETFIVTFIFSGMLFLLYSKNVRRKN